MFFIVRPQIGYIHKVTNLDPKRRALGEYYRVLVIDENLQFKTLLLTSNELLRVEDRKSKNPEEILIPSVIDKIFLFIYKLIKRPKGLWV
jgi:hypothetical protein